MKFKIFSMLVILGVLSVLPLIYMGKFDPVSMMGGDFSGGSEIAKLKAKAPKNLSNVTTDKKVTLYKWRDEHGVMQFSNSPPPSMKNAEHVELNPNENVVKAIKVPEKKSQKATAKSGSDMPNPYTVKGMKKVMDDARGIEDMLKKRQETQQKSLKNL